MSVRTRLSAAAGRRYYLGAGARGPASAPIVICNSRATADDGARAYGVPQRSLRVIYYGSDPRQLRRPVASRTDRGPRRPGLRADARRAAFIGALGDRRKGFDVLFDAWQQLTAAGGWDVDLLVAGVGAERRCWAAPRAPRPVWVRQSGFSASPPTCHGYWRRRTCWSTRRATRPTGSACTKRSAAASPQS